jgi:hypothetical protein
MGLKMRVSFMAALALAGPIFWGAGAVAAPKEMSPGKGPGMHERMWGTMCPHCGSEWSMAERRAKLREEWLAERQAQDAELDRLMAAVEAAPPEKKAEALAVVVARLLKERKEVHKNMAAWHTKMRDTRPQRDTQPVAPSTKPEPESGSAPAVVP